MQEYSIYQLVDPRDNIAHYIGVTTNPKERLKNHIRDQWKGQDGKKAAWLLELNSLRSSPKMEILEIVSIESDAEAIVMEREQYWIEKLASMGAPLINIVGITKPYAKSSHLRN